MLVRKFPLTVAIIDDEPTQLTLLRGLISKIEQVQVQAFNDPIEALEEIKKGKVSIVITDITMPQMYGDVLLREIQQLRLGIDVIICTSSSRISDAYSCLKAGARDLLLKPVNKDELSESIDLAIKHFERWNKIINAVKSTNKAAS